MKTRKKLIEVALPLEAINVASAREKSIRHGHPSTLHLWWARRPLASARAVIFAQMVDDPSACSELFPTEHEQQEERKRLFAIIEELVKWENTTNEKVLQSARDEIWSSWKRACADNVDHPQAKELFDPNKLPAFHDPFAGGGALPLEAQRLGLESYASDLNPVAVLINKAMIEIPPKFANREPVNPDARGNNKKGMTTWKGARGLAADVRYYGKWMRDEAEKRIGHLYPKVKVTPEMVAERPDLKEYEGKELTVIAWIWARTVKSPNPAFAHVDVPLASTFMLSTKAGKEAYVEPQIHGTDYRFSVKAGRPKSDSKIKSGTKSEIGSGGFFCLISGTPIPFDYVRAEGKAGRISAKLMAVVAEGKRGRVYLSPMKSMEEVAAVPMPDGVPETFLPEKALGFRVQEYGMVNWHQLYTPRQLVALTIFSDLVYEVRAVIERDARIAGLKDDSVSLQNGGVGALAYSEAVAVYLTFALSKQADLSNSLCRWEPIAQCPRQLFGRQTISMVWDYAEGNPLGSSSGSWQVFIDGIASAFGKTFEYLPNNATGFAQQADATKQKLSSGRVIATDPPYYDNIGYADLSDFFYCWMRRTLRALLPDLFSTLSVPKEEELVATPYRHGGKEQAEVFFLEGMTRAMTNLAEQAHPAFPVGIYYAFKQSENSVELGTTNTGWDTFLEAVIRAGFEVTGTWPMRTENNSRMRGQQTNALASSIVLVCNMRVKSAAAATRREFLVALKSELPKALFDLQAGNIAPVDLAQAAIGPGMAIFTRYSKVIDASGLQISVREALALINQVLDESLAEQEGDFDSDSRWALAWFEQNGFDEGEFGVAQVLATAKNLGLDGLVAAGIITKGYGKVRLLKPDELPADWNPLEDERLTAWEIVHHLVRVLEASGETSAADLLAILGAKSEPARELCYRLYSICERKKRATEALSYNGLVQSWPEISRLANEKRVDMPPLKDQVALF